MQVMRVILIFSTVILSYPNGRKPIHQNQTIWLLSKLTPLLIQRKIGLSFWDWEGVLGLSFWDSERALGLSFWDSEEVLGLSFWDSEGVLGLSFWDSEGVLGLSFWDTPAQDEGVFHLHKISENFHWEEYVPFVTNPIRSQAPLCRFTKRPLRPCYFLERRLSSSLAHQANAYYRHVWLWEDWHLYPPIFLGLQWYKLHPVNEELQRNLSELFMQHFKRKTCTGNNSFEQARISTDRFYMGHIRAAINFLDLALERGRQSNSSSPESLFAKIFQKTDFDPRKAWNSW